MSENREPNDNVTTMIVLTTAEVVRKDKSMMLAEAFDGALADAARAVHLYGKKASVSMTIRIVPVEQGRVQIMATLDEHLPKAAPRALTAFLDRGGILHEEDPRQLPIAEVKEFTEKKAAGDENS